MAKSVEDRVRAICMLLLEATEKLSHAAPSFFVRKQFVMLWPDGHHEPQRFFRTSVHVAGSAALLDVGEF